LKRIERTGFGQFLFYDWRFAADGITPNPEFELNHPALAGATILVTARNFGSGSSREHAPWALDDYGFRCIIAPSYADIFFNNCFQNGILPIVLSEEEVAKLMKYTQRQSGHAAHHRSAEPNYQRRRAGADSLRYRPVRKHRLVNGLDDIGTTLQHEAEITAFEAKRPAWSSRVKAALSARFEYM
jgi:3-isopropylmalate/(R)-2-methylmalate dehydratase small subunit